MTAPIRIWTPEDLLRLNELRAQVPALSWIAIGAEMGRSWAACKVQYFYQLRLKRQPKTLGGAKPTKLSVRQAADFAALEAREEQGQLSPRSLTAELFGDPLPGRSALDRINAGLAQPPVYLGRAARYPPKISLATGPL